MGPPPFRTGRLDFELMVLDDAEGMHGLRGEQEVMKWSSQKFADPDVPATKAWVEKILSMENAHLFTVRERGPEADAVIDLERIVGSLGVRELESSVTEGKGKRWEIGYMFVPRVWGRGYATEAVRGLVEEWFRGSLGEYLGAEVTGKGLYAVADMKNAPSLRILDKCGFVFVAEGVDRTDGALLGEYMTKGR